MKTVGVWGLSTALPCLHEEVVEVLVSLLVVHLLADEVTSRLSNFDLFNHLVSKSKQDSCVRHHSDAILPQLVNLAVQPFQIPNEFLIQDVLRIVLRFELALAFVDLSNKLWNSSFQIGMLRII